jgi:hypothetical protein
MTRSIVPIPILFASLGFSATLPEHRSVMQKLNARAMRLCALPYIGAFISSKEYLRAKFADGCRHGSYDKFVEREQTTCHHGKEIQTIRNWK